MRDGRRDGEGEEEATRQRGEGKQIKEGDEEEKKECKEARTV